MNLLNYLSVLYYKIIQYVYKRVVEWKPIAALKYVVVFHKTRRI